MARASLEREEKENSCVLGLPRVFHFLHSNAIPRKEEGWLSNPSRRRRGALRTTPLLVREATGQPSHGSCVRQDSQMAAKASHSREVCLTHPEHAGRIYDDTRKTTQETQRGCRRREEFLRTHGRSARCLHQPPGVGKGVQPHAILRPASAGCFPEGVGR